MHKLDPFQVNKHPLIHQFLHTMRIQATELFPVLFTSLFHVKLIERYFVFYLLLQQLKPMRLPKHMVSHFFLYVTDDLAQAFYFGGDVETPCSMREESIHDVQDFGALWWTEN